ncbi:putative exported protein [Plasmodium gaboni]|uniref:Putative exported protein n=1 Tax=Plasmodium gaboni TaxID=647221 RepID=A0A151LLH4_9APIC|nr:putative exported protein [Plasmodium gaboni]KYN99756.1 putative exported protein [Plasmodium gaboni]
MIINYFNKLNKITFETKRKYNLNTYLNLKKYIKDVIINSIKHNNIRIHLVFNKLFLFVLYICFYRYTNNENTFYNNVYVKNKLHKVWKFKVYRLLGESSDYFQEYNNYNPGSLLHIETPFQYIQEPTEHIHVHSYYTQQHSRGIEETIEYEKLLPYHIQQQPENFYSYSNHIEQPLDIISNFQNNSNELYNIQNECNLNYYNSIPREDKCYNNFNTSTNDYTKDHNNEQSLQNSTKNEQFYDKGNMNIQEEFYNDFVKFKDYLINEKEQYIDDINLSEEDKEKLKLLFETLNEMKFYENKISALNFKYYSYKKKLKKKKRKKSFVKMALTPIFVLLSMFTLNKIAPEVFSTAFVWLYKF